VVTDFQFDLGMSETLGLGVWDFIGAWDLGFGTSGPAKVFIIDDKV
jgi:hypothetical protein